MSEEIFVKLRYCFAGGYTLPQYCIDNGIKKPLFVMETAHECFLQEVCAQFRYDKRISLEQFCFIDGETAQIGFKQIIVGSSILVKHISQKSIDYFDAIIFLTRKKYNLKAYRVISFVELEKFFIQRTYVDIPILHFLQRNPGIKFFLTNFPNNINRYEGGKEFDKQLLFADELLKALKQNKGNPLETPFDKFGYTNKQVIELLSYDKAKKNADGTVSLIDDESPLMDIRNGSCLSARTL